MSAIQVDTLVVFDEAYLEYVADEARFDALHVLADAARRWIVLRTLSKAYGLADVRVGYGITSDPGLTQAKMKTRNPFGVNALAEVAAFADRAHLRKVTDLATSERVRVAAVLTAKGYCIAPSQANFLFFDTDGSAAPVAEALRQEGVLIKAWQEDAYRSWARVTMGSRKENDTFLDALPVRGV